jgi:hypothetical protein
MSDRQRSRRPPSSSTSSRDESFTQRLPDGPTGFEEFATSFAVQDVLRSTPSSQLHVGRQPTSENAREIGFAPRIIRAVSYFLAIASGLVLGAADQYLGSRIGLGGWAVAVSQMSAPWLVVPFIAGTTQTRPRKAMALGSAVTAAALVGYFAMTYSPLEGFTLDRLLPGMVLMMRTGYNPLWIAGGLVGGPLFGLLGQGWRVRRSWLSAASVVFVLCVEPFARSFIGWLPTTVWPSAVESSIGLVAALAFVKFALASRTMTSTGNAS